MLDLKRRKKCSTNDVCMACPIIIIKDNMTRESGQTKALDLTLTKEEEKVIYYVASYMVLLLRNKYKMLMSNKNWVVAVAEQVSLLRKSFKLRSFNFYIQDWLNWVNRSDLIKVNGDLFNFILKLEAVVRGILSVMLIRKHHDDDLREVLLQAMVNNDNVSTSWDSSFQNIPNETLSMILKKHFMLKLTDIRACS